MRVPEPRQRDREITNAYCNSARSGHCQGANVKANISGCGIDATSLRTLPRKAPGQAIVFAESKSEVTNGTLAYSPFEYFREGILCHSAFVISLGMREPAEFARCRAELNFRGSHACGHPHAFVRRIRGTRSRLERRRPDDPILAEPVPQRRSRAGQSRWHLFAGRASGRNYGGPEDGPKLWRPWPFAGA